MEESLGNNTTPEGGKDTMAALKARVEVGEAGDPNVTQAHETVWMTATSTTQPEVKSTPEATPEPGTQQTPVTEAPKDQPKIEEKDKLQQFRDKDGKVSEDKIQKSSEHLEKGKQEGRLHIAEMNETLLALHKSNKESQAEFTQVRQEEKALEKKVEEAQAAQSTQAISRSPYLTDERKAQMLKEANENPARLFDMIAEIARNEASNQFQPLNARMEDSEFKSLKTTRANELEKLVEKHQWIATEEGMQELQSVFQKRPFLFDSPTPYEDAVRFANIPNSNGTQLGTAHAGGSTPILGSSGASPPPVSKPPVTTESEMQRLQNEYNVVSQDRFYPQRIQKLNEIMAEREKLERKV